MQNKQYTPIPLFDTKKHMNETCLSNKKIYKYSNDFIYSFSFLMEKSDKAGTFNSYRREIERLINWSWYIKNKSILKLNNFDFHDYMQFIKSPPTSWVGDYKVRKFITINDKRVTNPSWKPFVYNRLQKNDCFSSKLNTDSYSLKDSSIHELLIILNSFYNFLLEKKYIDINPILSFKLTNYCQNARVTQSFNKLDAKQVEYLLKYSEIIVDKNPQVYERNLLIINLLCFTKLVPSELINNNKSQPKVGDIYLNKNGEWIINTNKCRSILLTNKVINSLQRWAKFLGFKNFSEIPKSLPLIPKYRSNGNISTITHLKRILKDNFEFTAQCLENNKLYHDAFIFREKIRLTWFNLDYS
ncbi:hypothetical protein L3V82_04240 [Thiotrichales bacterium 19S3-7]|nr:hypothetical protein [Thiotrichales bacterium 19S3-7]MCF6802681.1 hypothetical protein [Thiotrichales bacterium 19S3-11]